MDSMPTDRANDLRSFCDFAIQLTAGEPALKLDEALDRWEYENTTESEREETRRAIERGRDDMQAGQTVDAFEFVERMRQRLRPAEGP
jgi:hypothetical protein